MVVELLRRNVTPLAEETLADTPITVISGARQVGKSMLMSQLIRVVTYESSISMISVTGVPLRQIRTGSRPSTRRVSSPLMRCSASRTC